MDKKHLTLPQILREGEYIFVRNILDRMTVDKMTLRKSIDKILTYS